MEKYSHLITSQNVEFALLIIFMLLSLLAIRLASGYGPLVLYDLKRGKLTATERPSRSEGKGQEKKADKTPSLTLDGGSGAGTVSGVLISSTQAIIDSGIEIVDDFVIDIPESSNVLEPYIGSTRTAETDAEDISSLLDESLVAESEPTYSETEYIEPENWNCSECGCDNATTFVYCLNCGNSQQEEPPPYTEIGDDLFDSFDVIDDLPSFVPLICPECGWEEPEGLAAHPKFCGVCRAAMAAVE